MLFSFFGKKFDKWFYNKWLEARENAACNTITLNSSIKSGSVGSVNNINSGFLTSANNGITVTVLKANGGWVVTHQQYRLIDDRTEQNLFIVTDTEDLGQRLGEFITYISLKQ